MPEASNNILVLFAHPALHKSHVNRRLVEEPRGLDGVHVQDLYEEYPRFDIDVAREQQLLSEHDIIILQHPIYWYSTPSIFKEWQDLVLEHGWAYGSEGKALHGKLWLHVVTTGGAAEAYCAEGANRFTVRELLAPLEQTARLCGLHFLPPFIVYGAHGISDAEIEAHAADYRALLTALQRGQLDLDALNGMPRLNADITALLTSGRTD